MRVLGVIQARGGSRRIPGKNVKPLLGVPLIGYVCRAALASRRLTRVFLSTDDDEIAAAAAEYGIEAPFRRPPALAEDVPSEQVTLHALDWAEQEAGAPYEIVVTLQPTTPFLLPEHIDGCIETLLESDAASCFTAKRAVEPPQWMFERGADGTARTLLSGGIAGARGVFQSLPALYLPNGGAYATRTATLRAQERVIADPCRLVIMPPERSVDIDEPLDWILAEAVARECGFSLLPATEAAAT